MVSFYESSVRWLRSRMKFNLINIHIRNFKYIPHREIKRVLYERSRCLLRFSSMDKDIIHGYLYIQYTI